MTQRGVDVLIRGARVHDGERFLPEGTAVGIHESRLVLFHRGEQQPAAGEVIDGSGRVLTPAFVDVHNHGDLRLLSRDGINLLSQGVGTVIVGNCGFSPWGICARHPLFLDDSSPLRFDDAQGYMDALKDTALPVNAASLAGMAALLPEDGICARLAKALDAGCIGLSVGLNYEGQNRIGTAMLIEMGRVLAGYKDRWGGICWHIRDQGEHFLDAVAEVIRVHEAAGVACHINHLKRTGLDHPEEIDRALALIEPYPDITADMYPYVEGFSTLGALISVGAESVGTGTAVADCAMAGCRKFCPNLWADVILVGGVPEGYLGKSVEQIGAEIGKDGLAAFMQLHAQYPNATVCFMNQSHQSNVDAVLGRATSLVGSDGHLYGIGEHGHHPRAFGAFSRFFAHSRSRRWMSEEEAIRKMTSRPAKRFKLQRCGRILAGYRADLSLLRSERFRDMATFTRPNALSEGVELVIINGRKAFEKGRVFAKNGILLPPS